MSVDGPIRVLALVSDLMDRSRIEPVAIATGASVEFVPDVAGLRVHGDQSWDLVLIDLDAESSLDSLADLSDSPTVGYGSHVDRDLLDAARAAGFGEVVSRSILFRRLPTLLTAHH